MATYKILYWHDIPIQVRAEDENGRVGKELPERFQEAIDEAAMAAKQISDDPYIEGFQWGEEQEREGSAQEIASQVVAELDETHPEINWKETAKKIKNQS